MEKQEKPILEFRTWNKKILLFDQYQKCLENLPVAKNFVELEMQTWPEDQRIYVSGEELKVLPLWPVNVDKQKRGIDLSEIEGNLFIISDGYLYFDEDKLCGILAVYLSRVLLEWLPFRSNGMEKLGEIDEALQVSDLAGIESVHSLAGREVGNSRVWVKKLRKYLLEKAENLGNLR
ncbi:MAG: hypothetical protein ACRCZE_00275 [Candidatus Altimarinota bacterium]